MKKARITSHTFALSTFITLRAASLLSEALKLVFKKDNEFRNWLQDANHNGDKEDNQGGSLFEIAKKA